MRRKLVLGLGCLLAFAVGFWAVVLRPGVLFPKTNFLVGELRDPRNLTALRAWADELWQQRGQQALDEKFTMPFGGILLARPLKRGAAGPSFLERRISWWSPHEVLWVLDERATTGAAADTFAASPDSAAGDSGGHRVRGLGISWANMRGGLLVFPAGVPSGFQKGGWVEVANGIFVAINTVS